MVELPFGVQERNAFDHLFGGPAPAGTEKAEGSVHCPRAPTLEPRKGLRPQNRHSQKRKVIRPSGFLPVLVGPAGVSFPGSGLWFFFPVPACFFLFPSASFHWPRASRSSSRMGGTSGQTHGHRPKNRWRVTQGPAFRGTLRQARYTVRISLRGPGLRIHAVLAIA